MVVVQWMGFARIWYFYEADCCHDLTCCLIRETGKSLEPADRMDSCREEDGRTDAIW